MNYAIKLYDRKVPSVKNWRLPCDSAFHCQNGRRKLMKVIARLGAIVQWAAAFAIATLPFDNRLSMLSAPAPNAAI